MGLLITTRFFIALHPTHIGLLTIGKGVWSQLNSLSNQMQGLNEQAHGFAFDIIFGPLKEKLERVPKLEVG